MPTDENKIPGECPSCGSTNSILSGESEYSHGVYTDTFECQDCKEKWVEYFKYSGYDLIEENQ